MGSVANYYHVNGQWRSRENLTGVNVFLRPLQHAVNGVAFMDGGGGGYTAFYTVRVDIPWAECVRTLP